MKICHFITGLGDGGAEAALFRLVAHSRDHRHLVVSLTNDGKYAEALSEIGTAVVSLRLKSTARVASVPAALRKVREFDPDVVQSWMYHANLVGAGVARSILGVPNAWGIHNSGVDRATASLGTRAALVLSRLGSRKLPDLKISCSSRARENLITAGFDPHGWEVIPNGYDLSEFRFVASSRTANRNALKIPDSDFVIGTVARWHPDKDHGLLFAALRRIFEGNGKGIKVLLAGPGMSRDNPLLVEMVGAHGLADHVIMLGPITDVAGVMSVFDLHVLSSAREAFPNVVCEALACETPVVCTDTGDTAEIAGSLGRVVRPGDARALAENILEMIALRQDRHAWDELRRAGRSRVEEKFSIGRMVTAYEGAWERLLSSRHDAR